MNGDSADVSKQHLSPTKSCSTGMLAPSPIVTRRTRTDSTWVSSVGTVFVVRRTTLDYVLWRVVYRIINRFRSCSVQVRSGAQESAGNRSSEIFLQIERTRFHHTGQRRFRHVRTYIRVSMSGRVRELCRANDTFFFSFFRFHVILFL